MFKIANIRNLAFIVLISFFFFGSATNSNDARLSKFFESGITFGFIMDGALFGDPEFIDPEYKPENDAFLQKYLEENVLIGTVTGRYDLIDLPSEYLKNSIKDSPGDTVQILHSKGRFYALVEKVAYFFDAVGCYQGIVCVLVPADKVDDIRQIAHNFIMLRKDKFYSRLITPFHQYEISDPSYKAIVDSAITRMADSALDYEDGKLRRVYDSREGDLFRYWLEDRQYPSYPFPFIIIDSKAFGVKPGFTPDTLLVAITASIVSNTWYGWTSLLEIYADGDSWKSRTILEPHPGRDFDITCSIDLNGDSILEYFIISWDGALYTYIDGEFELVVYANYRGC